MSLSSRENIIEIRCNPGHVRMYELKMTASEPDQEVSPRHINRWWNVIINSVSELSWLMDEGNDYWKISYDRNYRLFWPIFDSKNSTLIVWTITLTRTITMSFASSRDIECRQCLTRPIHEEEIVFSFFSKLFP